MTEPIVVTSSCRWPDLWWHFLYAAWRRLPWRYVAEADRPRLAALLETIKRKAEEP